VGRPTPSPLRGEGVVREDGVACARGRIVCALGVPQPGRTRVHVGALAVVLRIGVACEIAVSWTDMGTET
jgi:hypothetical protein